MLEWHNIHRCGCVFITSFQRFHLSFSCMPKESNHKVPKASRFHITKVDAGFLNKETCWLINNISFLVSSMLKQYRNLTTLIRWHLNFSIFNTCGKCRWNRSINRHVQTVYCVVFAFQTVKNASIWKTLCIRTRQDYGNINLKASKSKCIA